MRRVLSPRPAWPLAGALAAVALVAACDGEAPGVDAGAVDAGAHDAGAPDAGAAGPRQCAPCRRDADCGEGALCMLLPDGSRGCGLRCASDEDCAGLAPAAACEEEDVGLPTVCRPTGGSCIDSAPGEACPPAGCAGRFDRCEEVGVGPRCTSACQVDADCPIGLRRCRDLGAGPVCVPDEAAPPERCAALIAAGGATPCGTDGACPSGAACYGSGATRLCLAPAPAGACPDGEAPWPTPAGGEVCVPTLPDPDGWARALAPDCACVIDDPGSMLDDALAAIGRDRCAMMFPHRILDAFDPTITHDPYRLSWTDRAHSYWPAALTLAEDLASSLDAAADGDHPISAPVRQAAQLADLRWEPPSDAPSADLAEALARLIEAGGETPDRAALSAEAGALPADLAGALTPIVDALRVAAIARREAIGRLVDAEVEALFDGASLLALDGSGLPLSQDNVRGALRGDVDVGRLAGAAVGLLEAIEGADLEAHAADASLTVETPFGVVAVRGTGPDTYDASWDGALLLVDLGGDDVYRHAVGATSSPTHGVSVAIDVGGVDDYGYAPTSSPLDDGPPGHRRLPSDAAGRAAPTARNGPFSRSTTSRQGAGRLGIGLLVDLGPEGDAYRSLRMSQGWGGLGVGVLYDRGGDDVYEGESGVQGGGAFGVGLLIDGGGNDHYVTYHASQGFAYARAVGLLYDGAGDDDYLSVVDDVLFVSAQDPTSNSSFSQGAGFGRRADSTPDRTFMSGGLGALRDRRGSDRYTAGVFAQATGYWYGAGMLLEGGGDDHYDGVWYVQSGDAHFAISVLLEAAGADDYNQLATRRNVAIGGGHDFSVAWFVDRAGDDVYRAPGISLGGGNEGGAGLFVDLAGADRYDATNGRSFGWAGIDRPGEDVGRMMSGTVGVFLEADGVDTYVRPEVGDVANDASWRQARNGPDEGELGVGLDRNGGRAGL